MFTVSNARVSLLVAMMVMLVLGGLAAGQFDQAQQDPALPVGSWSIDLQPDPGSISPPGPNFAAFTRDGILINSNGTGHAGIGSWTKVGPRSYAVTFTGAEMVEGQQLRFISRATLELSADSANLDGRFLSDLYAADGSYLGSATGTVHGERLAVQPMP
jgi:hypothetical protein